MAKRRKVKPFRPGARTRYKTPTELADAIATYVNNLEPREPLTMSTLAVGLGYTSRQSFVQVKDRGPEWAEVYDWAVGLCAAELEQRAAEGRGSMSGITLMLQNFGWENSRRVAVDQKTEYISRTPMEKASLIAKLRAKLEEKQVAGAMLEGKREELEAQLGAINAQLVEKQLNAIPGECEVVEEEELPDDDGSWML